MPDNNNERWGWVANLPPSATISPEQRQQQVEDFWEWYRQAYVYPTPALNRKKKKKVKCLDGKDLLFDD